MTCFIPKNVSTFHEEKDGNVVKDFFKGEIFDFKVKWQGLIVGTVNQEMIHYLDSSHINWSFVNPKVATKQDLLIFEIKLFDELSGEKKNLNKNCQ